MAIKYDRDYKDIIDELSNYIYKIDNFYEFFEMTKVDWSNYDEHEKKEFAKTLADDIFYALGSEGSIEIINSIVRYNEDKAVIEILSNNNISIVSLI